MKIGYLMQAGAPDMIAEPRSGPAAHVWHICDELRQLGCTVRVLAQAGGMIWCSDDLVGYQRVRVNRWDRGPLRWFESGVRRIQSMLHLPYLHMFDSLHFAAACRQELGDCDLLYERMGWMGYGGAIAAARSGQPLILEVNGDHLSEYEMLGLAPQGVQRAASLRLMRWAAHRAVRVVATGAGWRRRFVERWQVDPSRVAVVENGSEIVTLLRREQLAAFGAAVAPSAQHPLRIGYVGAFEPWHGVRVLVQALAQVVAAGEHVHLDLIGDGGERAAIVKLIEEYDIRAYVTLHGFLDIHQAAPLLARCEIGVSPYCGRVEFSGLKLLDYKAAGLATIASGQNGEPAVLRQGVTGWIVPPCDVDALAAAIVTLGRDAGLRRRIGQAARCEAEEQHSWRRSAQELVSLFDEVIAR